MLRASFLPSPLGAITTNRYKLDKPGVGFCRVER